MIIIRDGGLEASLDRPSAFLATFGQAIIQFALNVSLFKVQQKLCLIVIFAFGVHCSIKKFRFQNLFLFLIRSRVLVSQLFHLGLNQKVLKFSGLEHMKRSRSWSRS